MLRYEGATIADGTFDGLGPGVSFVSLLDSADGRITQVLKWTTTGTAPIRLSLHITGGEEAFPVQADPQPRALPIVRHSDGLSTSQLNRAVYDRRRDWLLSVDYPARVHVESAERVGGEVRVALLASGGEVALRFRPRFYQRHRGLAHYEPWTYRLPRDVPAGWTSWYAYRDAVTEDDVHRVADVMAERLAPFGYRWLQLDDGYQQLPIGVVDHWLRPNDKFPAGMDSLARYITGRGLRPGIWTNVSFQDSVWSAAHARFFVRSAGTPVWGNWIGWVLDANAPSTYDSVVAPVYDGFRRMGYQYFKIDALRHLRYEGFNSHATYFAGRGTTREREFRGVMARLRETIGHDRFILACWGPRPELIGLVDAMRIGDDGFGFGGLAQFNSFNNVVWRNDPDHIEIAAPDAYAAATATALTGSHLMLTDKAEVYLTPRVEVARRTAPVPSTVPQQVFDVDPSRSSQLWRADVEVSGAGPRPLDADQLPVTHLFQLDIARSFEHWTVLGRTGGEDRSIRFSDLGLRDSVDHLVFEFWTHRLVPSTKAGFALGPIDTIFRAQAFCIRERLARPQVVATSRHVTCGGPDLAQISWTPGALAGRSEMVKGDPYVLYLAEPAGARFVGVMATGTVVTSVERRGGLRVVRLDPRVNGTVDWVVRYGVDVDSPRRASSNAPSDSVYRPEALGAYARDIVGPKAIARATLLAGFDQWRGNPSAYERTWRGFGDRLGSRFAQVSISHTLRFGLSRAFDERSVTYRPCVCGDTGSRFNYALLSPLRVTSPTGIHLSVMNPISEVASGILVTGVRSSGLHVGEGIRDGVTGLAAESALSMLREFWPWKRRPPFL